MKYIPQAPPFVMIDEITDRNETETQTRFVVREGHLFVRAGCFTEPGLIENMAQTAAAGMGKSAADEGNMPPVGFIGQIKHLHISGLPRVGDVIRTRMKNKMQIGNAFVVEGTVWNQDQKIAAAEFKIFLQE
jgi:3-hydroxymyristoyl/3-hydroxydecanoyl-(acyl carrier protein) dehydratase